MANTCFNEYIIKKGTMNQKDFDEMVTLFKESYEENDWEKFNKKYGVEIDSFAYISDWDGSIPGHNDLSEFKEQFGFSSESNWDGWEANKQMKILEENTGVEIIYMSEEFGCEYFITNDKEGAFPHAYAEVCSDNYDNIDGCYYDSEEEAVEDIKKEMNIEDDDILNFDELGEYLCTLEEFEDGDSYFSFYNAEYIELGDA